PGAIRPVQPAVLGGAPPGNEGSTHATGKHRRPADAGGGGEDSRRALPRRAAARARGDTLLLQRGARHRDVVGERSRRAAAVAQRRAAAGCAWQARAAVGAAARTGNAVIAGSRWGETALRGEVHDVQSVVTPATRLVAVLMVFVVVLRVVRAHLGMPRLTRVGLRHALFERLELMQHLIAVERADVPRLDGREAAHGPAQMHEMRLDGMREGMHPDLFRQPVSLARIAGAARGDDVGPVVRAAAGERDEVVARERLARLELGHVPTTVLAAVVVAGKEERVRDMA